MSNKTKFQFAAVLVALVVAASPISAAWAKPIPRAEPTNWDDWDVVPGTVLVSFTPAKTVALKTGGTQPSAAGLVLMPLEQAAEALHRANNPAKAFRSLLPNMFQGRFDPKERGRVLEALAKDPEIEFFEPNRIRISNNNWGTSQPNDPDIGFLWGMRRIGASNVWAHLSAARAPVRVAVMEDDRFDAGHVDLAAQVSGVQNHAGNTGDHATHVSGIIAATGNNGIGVVGVANVELAGLGPVTDSATFANLITWAVNNQVRVINMSWKWCGSDGTVNPCDHCVYPAPSQTEQNAINSALGQIVFVAAAGNDSCDTDANGRRPVPASYGGVLAVSALTEADTLAGFSNFGPYVDLAAPGSNIRSAVIGNGFAYKDGTSMAAPHVAGTVAALFSLRPNFDARSIFFLLTLTAEDLGPPGFDNNFGWGVVRADRAAAALADVYATLVPTLIRTGTLEFPYTFVEAISNCPAGGTIGLVRTGSTPYPSPGTISKPCTIIAVGGTATIGQ